MVENKPTDLFHGHPLPAWICEPHTARILDVNQTQWLLLDIPAAVPGICLHDIWASKSVPTKCIPLPWRMKIKTDG